MGAKQYVALLRGINVGGRNPVSMANLRQVFETEGYSAVSTYIQSGNVLFESEVPSQSLEKNVETVLGRRLDFVPVVVVRSHRQLRSIVENAPDGFGATPEIFHSDVIFLKAPLSTSQAMLAVDRRDGVDQVWEGSGVLYFSRLSARRTESRMGRIMGTPEYQQMTIRNWNTTTKLLSLLDARSAR